MAARVYVELLARILVATVLAPVLIHIMGYAALAVDILPSLARGSLTFEEAASLVNISLIVFSLLLLLASIVYVDPILYTLSLLPATAATLDASIATGFNSILALILILSLNVVLQGYRSGQGESFRVRGLAVLLASLTLLAIAILSSTLVVSTTLWAYVEAFRGVEVESDVLKPLVRFLSGNPLGLALVVATLLAIVYSVAANISETLILYMKPSRDIALKALTIDPYTPIKPPLTSLRNAMITLAISPALYALLVKVLPLPLQASDHVSLENLGWAAARWALSVLVLLATWMLVTRALTRFDEVEPSLRGLALGVTLIALVYLLLFLSGLWDPRVEGLDFNRADKYLSEVVVDYYKILFSILEIVPMLVGLAP